MAFFGSAAPVIYILVCFFLSICNLCSLFFLKILYYKSKKLYKSSPRFSSTAALFIIEGYLNFIFLEKPASVEYHSILHLLHDAAEAEQEDGVGPSVGMLSGDA